MVTTTEGTRPAGSPGVHAALSVIERIVASGPMAQIDLVRELDLPKSTLHRICTILVDRGWAVRDEHGRYAPGIRAIGIGSRSSDLPIITGFRHAVAPLMERHDETVCLAVLDGASSLFIAIEETSQPVRLLTWVGRRDPAFASASGRAMLAALPRDAVAAEFGDRPLVRPTGRPLRSLAELQRILAVVRRDGYAESDEETAVGLYCASVPIVNDTGATIAALTMCVPTSRMTGERRLRLIEDLRAAAADLSREVAWMSTFDARRS